MNKAIERFYTWREQKLKENPDWCDETRDWFLGMYMQTYPARTPSIVTELFDYYEGTKLQKLVRCVKRLKKIQEEKDNDDSGKD